MDGPNFPTVFLQIPGAFMQKRAGQGWEIGWAPDERGSQRTNHPRTGDTLGPRDRKHDGTPVGKPGGETSSLLLLFFIRKQRVQQFCRLTPNWTRSLLCPERENHSHYRFNLYCCTSIFPNHLNAGQSIQGAMGFMPTHSEKLATLFYAIFGKAFDRILAFGGAGCEGNPRRPPQPVSDAPDAGLLAGRPRSEEAVRQMGPRSHEGTLTSG